MTNQLFPTPTPTATRYTGTRLPARYVGPELCVKCHHGAVVRLTPYTLEPLLIGVGYGESVEIHATRCPACADTRVVNRISHRPAIARRFKSET